MPGFGWEKPTLKVAVRIEGSDIYDNKSKQTTSKPSPSPASIYDVKFCPFLPLDADPIFAMVARRSITVCRVVKDSERSFEIIRIIVDDQSDSTVDHNSIAWVQDPTNGDPLVAFSGELPNINLVNVATGQVTRTLCGHGAPVNDIVVCPTLPSILASCSQDHSIRLWNLKPEYEQYPCSVLCTGGGHSASVMSLDFHLNGRFLISGGYDTYIHLWVIPELMELDKLPKTTPGEREEVKRIHFPHFSTADLHSNYIDCVKFVHGDLIVSRAVNEGTILLWKIDGFSSSSPIPSNPPTERGVEKLTRSAFGNGFQRLMQFGNRDTGLIWMRFDLFRGIDRTSVLAMGNGHAELLFWNLETLDEEAEEGGFEGSPFVDVEPHGKIIATRFEGKGNKRTPLTDTMRAVAFSPDGEWCVGGGDNGRLLVCARGNS